MKAEEWLYWEIFLNNWLPILFGVTLVFILALFFCVVYAPKGKGKILSILLLCVATIATGMYTYLKIQASHEFVEYSKNQNSVVRDRVKKPFRYERLAKLDSLEWSIEYIENLGFYEKKEHIDDSPITYLGKTEHIYYLKIYNRLYNVNLNSPNILFTDIDKPTRIGVEYFIKDKDYEALGFYKEIGPIYTKILLPKNMEELIYEDIDERSVKLEF